MYQKLVTKKVTGGFTWIHLNGKNIQILGNHG